MAMPRAFSAHLVVVALIAGVGLAALGPASASQQPATTGQATAPSEEAARKQADDKAWADAVRVGTAAAFNGYIQKFPSGAHIAEARSRLAAHEAKARADAQATRAALAAIPVIDVKKTCDAAARLPGAKLIQESASGCILSEEAAREEIAKQWAEFTAADRSRCIKPKVYLPSYVEWLTCLEMERDVRNLRREPSPASPGTGRRPTP
jgi:hypothetical protein